MDGAVATLQNAINRFAVIGGFPRVTVDGLWGNQTKQGVFSALAFIGQGKCYKSACPDSETSRSAAGIMAQWDESMNAARGLSEFLGGVADDLGLPLVATPIVTSGGGAPGPLVPVPALHVSLIERFKVLPLWQQVGFGVAGSLVIWFIVNLFTAPKEKTRRGRQAA